MTDTKRVTEPLADPDRPPAARTGHPLADVSAADVEAAADALRGVVDATPLEHNARLSSATGAEVFLKREDLQPTRSYKGRGAYTFVSRLTREQRLPRVLSGPAGTTNRKPTAES